MTVRNKADQRSEALRRRKRRAINRHLSIGHHFKANSLRDHSTLDRMAAHELMHMELSSLMDHSHKDFEDWQELERMHGGQGN